MEVEGNDDPDKSVFDVIDKETGQFLDSGGISISSKYRTQIINGKVELVSGNGLNLAVGKIYGGNFGNSIQFGFDRSEPMLQDYLKKSLSRLDELNRINVQDYERSQDLYSPGVILELYELLESGENKELFGKLDSLKIEKTTVADFEELIKKFGSSESALKVLENLKYYNGQFLENTNWQTQYELEDRALHLLSGTGRGPLSLSPHLPIFINDKKIPQLRWGHASYAFVPTEKTYNFFRMHHADDFPEA